jgi:hypothetical protein
LLIEELNKMDPVSTLVALLIGMAAVALAYSSVPRIRKLERRVEDLERQVSAMAETGAREASG